MTFVFEDLVLGQAGLRNLFKRVSAALKGKGQLKRHGWVMLGLPGLVISGPQLYP